VGAPKLTAERETRMSEVGERQREEEDSLLHHVDVSMSPSSEGFVVLVVVEPCRKAKKRKRRKGEKEVGQLPHELDSLPVSLMA